MPVDRSAVQAIMLDANPWAKLLEAKLECVEPGHVVLALRPHEQIANPFGAVHAGALYTFAETSAASLVIASLELAGRSVVMKAGNIVYQKMVQQPIQVDARWSETECAALQRQIDAAPRAEFPVTITATFDDGTPVFTATFTVVTKQVAQTSGL